MSDLFQRAVAAIDGWWRYSEHWPKDADGRVTEEGWRRALYNGETQISTYRKEIERLRQKMRAIEIVIKEIMDRELNR